MPLTPEIISFIMAIVGSSIAINRSITSSIDGVRRQLDDRLDLVQLQLKDIDRSYQVKDVKFEQDILRLEGSCNGNKELINHRSNRAEAAYGKLESRVSSIEVDLHNRLRSLESAMNQGATYGKASN